MHIDPPVCPGCAYGKAHRHPWRHKGSRNGRRTKPATFLGQVVSVDQLVSPAEGFVPTHCGTPTTQRYIGATVFVDHFSNFTFVHLMTKLDADSTVKAKLAFERVSASHGVVVKHYHADNGLFDTKTFQAAVLQSQQSLTFCGVNAHHQNGRAESRIKDITTHARTYLLHAAHCWPKAINAAALWPAALKHYTNTRNVLPTEFVTRVKHGRMKDPDRYKKSALSKFSGTEVNLIWITSILLAPRYTGTAVPQQMVQSLNLMPFSRSRLQCSPRPQYPDGARLPAIPLHI
jgi:hypothetical protein